MDDQSCMLVLDWVHYGATALGACVGWVAGYFLCRAIVRALEARAALRSRVVR
jgi:hypothetical protein